tara:strand:- start:47 stop:700 length:654 start_codon:yes stop_codon:yes gene_type:complete
MSREKRQPQMDRGTPFTRERMGVPTRSFDDSNRENYIMSSNRGLPTLFDRAQDVAPIQIFPPNPNPNIIVDYEEGRGGRDSSMLPDFTAPIEPVIETTPEESLGEKLRDIAGLLGPGSGLGDPTGEGGIIQRLGEFLGLTDPIDPENEGLPMDEYQEYRERGLKPMMDEIAMDDTYTLPNLLQMLDDARDAGNEEEMERYMNDLELLYPGATMSGIV